jgi:hypothetical protein
VGPAIGDLDGDGQPELVICSQGSELIDSGRILVFDLGAWRCAQYQPILDGFAVYGVGDLKLRDVEGNGRLQIVIGTDSIYDGVIVVYRFDSNNTFTSIWTNSTLPQGSPIKFVEVADLDNNGTLKIIGGNYDAFGNGVYVYAYDYPSIIPPVCNHGSRSTLPTATLWLVCGARPRLERQQRDLCTHRQRRSLHLGWPNSTIARPSPSNKWNSAK